MPAASWLLGGGVRRTPQVLELRAASGQVVVVVIHEKAIVLLSDEQHSVGDPVEPVIYLSAS